MLQTWTKTWWAHIFVGRRALGYSSFVHSNVEVEQVCADFCDREGLCVTVTPTQFFYEGGKEVGSIVGLIQYPRFPKTEKQLLALALELGARLREKLQQIRVSIQTPTETVMLGPVDDNTFVTGD